MPIVKNEDKWEDEEVGTDEEENYGLNDEDIYLQECIVELRTKAIRFEDQAQALREKLQNGEKIPLGDISGNYTLFSS
ncbi:hypothetical protein J4E91_002437 [Alternaria rosae]|nr:hypothetical protein J4E91_002437 [Alternaria rosae]